ncbi:MAG: ABC transporter ATP-binding protein [Acidimicrobiia bacterium]
MLPPDSAADEGTPALEVRAVTVRFGGNIALDGVALSAQRGLVTGLIGPNGAGKTTLFNVITGLLAPSRGEVYIEGRDVSKLRPSRRARLGLARTFQRLELFNQLSVRENVLVAADIRRTGGHNRGGFIDGILERVGLTDVADARVDTLSTGRARLIELGRALATVPKIVLLDEPASGQDEQETHEFGVLLRELASEGLAVVLVEHDVQLVMEVCDVIHVLDFGRIISAGTPHEVQHDEAVLAAYLGTKP